MSVYEVIDERARPGFRKRLGDLLAAAETADLAVARIRLAALDLTEAELSTVRRCRVLLRHFDAAVLADAADPAHSHERRAALERLSEFTASGRLEVRSAGVGLWNPDFSVFTVPGFTATMVGAHQFGAPYPSVGPLFTTITHDLGTARLAAARFRALWRAGHDVLPAIRQILEQDHGVGAGVAGAGR